MPFLRQEPDNSLAETLGNLGSSLGNALNPLNRIRAQDMAIQIQQRQQEVSASPAARRGQRQRRRGVRQTEPSQPRRRQPRGHSGADPQRHLSGHGERRQRPRRERQLQGPLGGGGPVHRQATRIGPPQCRRRARANSGRAERRQHRRAELRQRRQGHQRGDGDHRCDRLGYDANIEGSRRDWPARSFV